MYAYIVTTDKYEGNDELRAQLKDIVRKDIGPIAMPGKIQFVPEMPKNRSGKIVRRILRKIASGAGNEIDDSMLNILVDPEVVRIIDENRIV